MTTFNDAIVEDVLATIRNSEPWEIPARSAIDVKRARPRCRCTCCTRSRRSPTSSGRCGSTAGTTSATFPKDRFVGRAATGCWRRSPSTSVRSTTSCTRIRLPRKAPAAPTTGDGQPVGRLRIDANCAIALDFVKDGQKWIDEKPPRHTVRDRARRRSNQHLMHLDWRRVEQVPSDAYEKGTTWPLDAMFDAIVPAILAFIEHVRHELVVPEFIRRALAIRERSHPDRADDEELGVDRPPRS